jgi:hypothetical protein
MEIEILYHTDTTKMLKDLDMEFNWDDLDRVMAYFCNIDVILPYFRDGVEYTEIHVGNHTYISTVPYLLLKKILIQLQ